MKHTFPGFKQCLRMMRHHDAAIREDGYHYLLPYAHEYTAELTAAFHAETDQGLRGWLFELLGEASAPDLLPLFATALRGEDPALWERALRALKKLDTKEARHLIFEARSYTFPTQEQTGLFRTAYDRVIER
jgi:hypothetical protein